MVKPIQLMPELLIMRAIIQEDLEAAEKKRKVRIPKVKTTVKKSEIKKAVKSVINEIAPGAEVFKINIEDMDD